VKEGRHKHTGC